MGTLCVNKRNILCDFERLSNIWTTSENIFLCLDIKQSDIEFITNELLKKLPNDLAYSIMSELAETEGLDDNLMRLIYENGDKGCKVAICLRDDLAQELRDCCERSDDIDIRDHYMQKMKK